MSLKHNIVEPNENIKELRDSLKKESKRHKTKAKDLKSKYDMKIKQVLRDVDYKILELENEYK